MVRAVRHALRVLDLLARSDASLGVTEIAGQLALPPSTVHRLLATLVAEGWARRVPARRYLAGPRLDRVPVAPPPRSRLVAAARPVLRWLADASGEAAHLAVLEGTTVISIEHAEGPRGRPSTHATGTSVPAHATAIGLALLANHPQVAQAVLDAGLARWTDRTVADEAAFRRRLGDAQRRGYAVNLRGWIDGTAGVAAPVIDEAGLAVASVGLSGPADRVARRAAVVALGSLVRAGAGEIAARLRADSARRTGATSSR